MNTSECQQRHHRDVLFVDEVQRVRQALRPAAGRMDVSGDVELHHLLVERVPEPVAERRRLDAAALTGIRIQQEADEAALLDALLEIREHGLGADAGRQRQTADAAEGVGIELHLLGDDVVGLLDEPLDEPRILAGHHLVRARRDELQVRSDLLQLTQMRAAAEDRRVERLPSRLRPPPGCRRGHGRLGARGSAPCRRRGCPAR